MNLKLDLEPGFHMLAGCFGTGMFRYMTDLANESRKTKLVLYVMTEGTDVEPADNLAVMDFSRRHSLFEIELAVKVYDFDVVIIDNGITVSRSNAPSMNPFEAIDRLIHWANGLGIPVVSRIPMGRTHSPDMYVNYPGAKSSLVFTSPYEPEGLKW